MKFSSIKTEKEGAVRLRSFDSNKFFERIRTDANNFIISTLRTETTPEHPEHYRRYSEVPQICATAELRRQENGALGMAAFNGLVELEVRQVMSAETCEAIKQHAGATFKAPSVNAFARTLSGIEGLQSKRLSTGRVFCVRPRF